MGLHNSFTLGPRRVTSLCLLTHRNKCSKGAANYLVQLLKDSVSLVDLLLKVRMIYQKSNCPGIPLEPRSRSLEDKTLQEQNSKGLLLLKQLQLGWLAQG